MRLLLVIGLCIIANACNNGGSYHRGYVISKAIETETLNEPELEDIDLDNSFSPNPF
jgi:hypothetical protein